MALSVQAALAQDTIIFTTEDYPPYNFTENGIYKGVGYDQVMMIMKDIGIEYTVELMPWARAYAMAQSDSMTCVFTTAHTPERDQQFKWVEPLGHDRNIMTSKADANIHVTNIEQARNYRVGTQRDDYTQVFLEKNGFQKIDLAASLDLTLKKLESGRIDLVPISEKFFYDLVAEGHPLAEQFILTEQTFALACNKSVPDTLITKMQASLDKLIADGRQKAIFKQYGMRGY
ncbi:MAG TPA: ABC transporter substrate-binding protein [Rhizobium sp.]|nr:ABC transporter substrate-binding protein [Rhizobium sp.]